MEGPVPSSHVVQADRNLAGMALAVSVRILLARVGGVRMVVEAVGAAIGIVVGAGRKGRDASESLRRMVVNVVRAATRSRTLRHRRGNGIAS